MSAPTKQTLPPKQGGVKLTPELHQYILDVSLREPEVLKKLREETSTHNLAGMQISADEGQFMHILAKLMNAKKALEVGVFTGYSSTAVALALPPDGKLVAMDVSEEYTNVARKYWKEAGVSQKVDLRLGPAVDTLKKLISEGQSGQYDMAFIDADKSNYDNYYELCLTLLRPGGALLIDNTLWDGRVADPKNHDIETVAIRALNSKIHKDQRVELSLLALGDGVTMVLKK